MHPNARTVALFVAGCLVSPLTLVAAACPPRHSATLKATLSRAADRVVVRREGGAVLVEINSASGIGQAALVAPGGRWPRDVRVRIRGLGLARLEGFSLTKGQLTLHSAAGREWPESRGTVRGKVIERSEDRRFRLHIELKAYGGKHLAEVALPRELLAGEEPLQIEWVDAYRT
jgi:hypothetical protein